MPKYILGKDFHKNVGKKILMPHPTDPKIEPVELKIVRVENKRVTLELVGFGIQKEDNYSKDKNKYLVIE